MSLLAIVYLLSSMALASFGLIQLDQPTEQKPETTVEVVCADICA